MPAHPLSRSQRRDSDAQKIGLALGGGAARGIAHAGVLKWLEEHRIPVDYVAGTSMGGLVGGAYATGMSAAQIEELLLGAARLPLRSLPGGDPRDRWPFGFAAQVQAERARGASVEARVRHTRYQRRREAADGMRPGQRTDADGADLISGNAAAPRADIAGLEAVAEEGLIVLVPRDLVVDVRS